MLVHFDNALLDLWILHDLFFKVCSTNLLDSSLLFHLLGLIEVMNFTIKILIYEFIEVLLNVIEEDDLSVFVEVKVIVSQGQFLQSTSF